MTMSKGHRNILLQLGKELVARASAAAALDALGRAQETWVTL